MLIHVLISYTHAHIHSRILIHVYSFINTHSRIHFINSCTYSFTYTHSCILIHKFSFTYSFHKLMHIFIHVYSFMILIHKSSFTYSFHKLISYIPIICYHFLVICDNNHNHLTTLCVHDILPFMFTFMFQFVFIFIFHNHFHVS